MWRLALVAVCTGCGFAPSTAVVLIDAPAGHDAVDATHDAGPLGGCQITAKGTASGFTSLGGSGGILQPDITCAAGELPIALLIETTTNPRPEGGNGGERVVTSFHTRCGGVRVLPDASYVVTPAELVGWSANACVPAWSPFTTTLEVPCPITSPILIGLVDNDGPTTLFNSVSMICATVDTFGGVGFGPSVAIVDTGNYSNNPGSAACFEGSAILAFGVRGNCGIDQLTPRCAELQCN